MKNLLAYLAGVPGRTLAKLRREPVLLRGIAAGAVNLLVVSGVIDTGASDEAEVVVLGVLNLLLLKGARDKVEPVQPDGFIPRG